MRRLSFCLLACLVWFPGAAQAQLPFRNFSPFDEESIEDDNRAQIHDKLRVEAEAAYQKRDYKKVVEITTEMIAAEPKQPFAYYQRSSAYIDSGRLTRSRPQILQGVADARQGLLLAGNKYPYLYIPYLYGLTSLSEMDGRPENADLAIKVATPVLDRPEIPDSERAYIHYQRALAYAAKKDFKAAAEDYAAAARGNPALLAAFLGEAEALASAGDFAKARSVFNRTADLFPRQAVVFNNRGNFLRQQGDSSAALSDFDRALQLEPQLAVAYTNRGVTYSSLQRSADAERDFLASLQIDPNQSAVRQFLGNSQLSRGQLKPALQEFSAAIQLAPGSALAYADRGFARYFAKDYSGAAADFDKSMQLNRTVMFVIPWRYLAGAHGSDPAKAKLELARNLKAAGTVNEFLGKTTAYLLGDLSAEEFPAAANAQDPRLKNEQLCEVHYFIAQRLELAGQAEAASEHYKECLKTKAYQLSAYRGARYALNDFAKSARE